MYDSTSYVYFSSNTYVLAHLVQKHELQTKQYFVSLWKKKEAAEARYFLGSM